jgi:hypothetical protein
MKFFVCVYDRLEGKIRVTVDAKDEDEASECARVAAAENGCHSIVEVIVEDGEP